MPQVYLKFRQSSKGLLASDHPQHQKKNYRRGSTAPVESNCALPRSRGKRQVRTHQVWELASWDSSWTELPISDVSSESSKIGPSA